MRYLSVTIYTIVSLQTFEFSRNFLHLKERPIFYRFVILSLKRLYCTHFAFFFRSFLSLVVLRTKGEPLGIYDVSDRIWENDIDEKRNTWTIVPLDTKVRRYLWNIVSLSRESTTFDNIFDRCIRNPIDESNLNASTRTLVPMYRA